MKLFWGIHPKEAQNIKIFKGPKKVIGYRGVRRKKLTPSRLYGGGGGNILVCPVTNYYGSCVATWAATFSQLTNSIHNDLKLFPNLFPKNTQPTS